MKRTASLVAVCTAFIAVNVFAQLSPQYQQWGNAAARYLMMKQEKTDWTLLKSDADARTFIEVFWARRDPTADTPVNELRQQFEKRTADANQRYGSTETPGSLTDRGVVYVLLGPASQIVSQAVPPRAPAGSLGQLARPINVESWIYRNQEAERALGTKSFEIVFAFHDEKFAGEFVLDETSQKAFESSALNVAKSVLKRPFLTQADLAAGGDSGRTVALRLIVVADTAIAHDVLRRAQEGHDFASLARKYSSQPSAQRGGYVGRVAFADLTDDFKVALAGKEPGATVLIARQPQFAIVRLLTETEAAAAEAEMAKPK
jgi:GWxTD domain-containing protein